MKSGVSESLLRKYLAADSLPDTGKHARSEYSVPPELDTPVQENGDVQWLNGSATDALAFKSSWVKDQLHVEPHYLALMRVRGDAMEPTVWKGDAVLLNVRHPKFTDDGLYFLKQFNSLAVKRVQHSLNGELIFKSDNTACSDERLSATDAASVHIAGRVVWTGRHVP